MNGRISALFSRPEGRCGLHDALPRSLQPAAAPEAPPAKRAGALGDDEGEITVDEESSASARGAGGPPASSTGPTAPGMPRADELQRAAEAMRSNPQMMQSYMEMLSNMTQEQIDAMVASTGQTLPGGQRLTPGELSV